MYQYLQYLQEDSDSSYHFSCCLHVTETITVLVHHAPTPRNSNKAVSRSNHNTAYYILTPVFSLILTLAISPSVLTVHLVNL